MIECRCGKKMNERQRMCDACEADSVYEDYVAAIMENRQLRRTIRQLEDALERALFITGTQCGR